MANHRTVLTSALFLHHVVTYFEPLEVVRCLVHVCKHWTSTIQKSSDLMERHWRQYGRTHLRLPPYALNNPMIEFMESVKRSASPWLQRVVRQAMSCATWTKKVEGSTSVPRLPTVRKRPGLDADESYKWNDIHSRLYDTYMAVYNDTRVIATKSGVIAYGSLEDNDPLQFIDCRAQLGRVVPFHYSSPYFLVASSQRALTRYSVVEEAKSSLLLSSLPVPCTRGLVTVVDGHTPQPHVILCVSRSDPWSLKKSQTSDALSTITNLERFGWTVGGRDHHAGMGVEYDMATGALVQEHPCLNLADHLQSDNDGDCVAFIEYSSKQLRCMDRRISAIVWSKPLKASPDSSTCDKMDWKDHLIHVQDAKQNLIFDVRRGIGNSDTHVDEFHTTTTVELGYGGQFASVIGGSELEWRINLGRAPSSLSKCSMSGVLSSLYRDVTLYNNPPTRLPNTTARGEPIQTDVHILLTGHRLICFTREYEFTFDHRGHSFK